MARAEITTDENWIGQLPDEVRTAIGERMVRTALAPGDRVKTAGDPPVAIHQVIRGHVKLTGLYQDGRESLIAIYAAGNCFSETAMVASRPYHHSAVALTESLVGFLGRDDFWPLYHRFPAIPDALCRKFAGTIGRQLQAREARATQRLSEQIASMFKTLADRCAEVRAANSCVIAVPITQNEIADHFDVTRQAVHREISALKSSGIIDKQGGRWIVRDLARLGRL